MARNPAQSLGRKNSEAKGLAKLFRRTRHGPKGPSLLTRPLLMAEGGYSPMTGRTIPMPAMPGKPFIRRPNLSNIPPLF